MCSALVLGFIPSLLSLKCNCQQPLLSPSLGCRFLHSRAGCGSCLGIPSISTVHNTQQTHNKCLLSTVQWPQFSAWTKSLVNDVIWLSRKDFSSGVMPFSQLFMNSLSHRFILGQVVAISWGTTTSQMLRCMLCAHYAYSENTAKLTSSSCYGLNSKSATQSNWPAVIEKVGFVLKALWSLLLCVVIPVLERLTSIWNCLHTNTHTII